MSATTKKKHVTKEVLEDYPLPEGNRQVVKVTAARGNNLHEVETAQREKFLVSMPSKFRKHVWIKRGDFILVEPIEEGDKVKAEISHILFKDQVKYIQDHGMWPEEFTEKPGQQNSGMIPDDLLPPSDEENSEDDLGDLCINVNRIAVEDESESEEDSSDEYEEKKDGKIDTTGADQNSSSSVDVHQNESRTLSESTGKGLDVR